MHHHFIYRVIVATISFISLTHSGAIRASHDSTCLQKQACELHEETSKTENKSSILLDGAALQAVKKYKEHKTFLQLREIPCIVNSLYLIGRHQPFGIERRGILQAVEEESSTTYRLIGTPTLYHVLVERINLPDVVKKLNPSELLIEAPTTLTFHVDSQSTMPDLKNKKVRHWCVYPAARGILYIQDVDDPKKYTHYVLTCSPTDLNN